MTAVRDRLWLWSHAAGSHTDLSEGRPDWGIGRSSRITPTEACYYMGIPNCIMVVYGNRPEPPFHREALAMSTLDKVVWSIVGDAGSTRTDDGTGDLDEVLCIAERFPNICGAMMDDFFHEEGGRHASATVAGFHDRLRAFRRPLDLWVVLYKDQLDRDFAEHLRHCDLVTFWTPNGSELVDLAGAFQTFVQRTPGKRRALGCYMWNYGEKRPLTVAQMAHQCSLGLRWLSEGLVEGMIFLASCICDLELDAVEWTRSWVAEVGCESLPGEGASRE